MHIIDRDLRHIWHPASQMKDYEQFHPLVIQRAYGPYLELENGERIIDAISSWWCKSLGHNHSRIKRALIEQVEQFEHVIAANTCQRVLVELSEKLANLTATLPRVFYAGDGSSAIEIAMKMSLHSRKLASDNGRHHFMALSNSYHGETGLALSASDIGVYKAPYEKVLIPVLFLEGIPYVHSKEDPLWQDCSAFWPHIEAQLNMHCESLTAILIEPIVQGAGGMLIYSQDFLRRLRIWTLEHQVHLIADEIMTGFGRTGTMLACSHSGIEPDFLCLSKGMTSGWLPMSAVLTSNQIYQQFYADYGLGKSFLHSHTYTGNALAASVALETLKIFEEEGICRRVQTLEPLLKAGMMEVADKTGCLKNVRSMGAIVAADLVTEVPRKGFEVFQAAVRLGAFLRPLGNTIYWFLPLNIEEAVLNSLKEITIRAIEASL